MAMRTDDVQDDSDQVRVVVCDSHPIMRAGVLAIVERDPRLTVVGQASTTAEALNVAHRTAPAVMVVRHSPADLDGAEISRGMVRHGNDGNSPLRVVTLTGEAAQDDPAESQKETLGLLHAGVRGVLPSQSAPAELVRVIHAVVAGSVVLATSSAVRLLDRLVDRFATTAGAGSTSLGELTERETEILQLIAAGLSNQAIATRLRVSQATVKSHFYRLSQKLDLQSRAQAVVLAYETGIVSSLS